MFYKNVAKYCDHAYLKFCNGDCTACCFQADMFSKYCEAEPEEAERIRKAAEIIKAKLEAR